jgi:hypothetical protein
MGSVRLLSRQGEVELAKRMERGNHRMRKALAFANGLGECACIV